MSDLSFKNIEYLYGLTLLLPLIGIYFYTLRKRPASVGFSSLLFFTTIPKTIRVRLRHLPFILRMLSLTLLIIILAGPVKKGGIQNIEKEGINIVIALDISTSMKEEDLSPNRLEVAKQKAEQFIAKRVNDRIGLVIFGSEAFLQCPLTLDHQILTTFVKKIDFMREISSQTAIGNAIAMSVIALKRGQYQSNTPPNAFTTNVSTSFQEELTPPQKTKKDSQIIVLITDGRNTSTELDPLTAAQIAQNYGIKIYTIGIGKPEPNLALLQPNAPSSSSDPTTQPNFYTQSLIDEATLRKVAELTSGKYFNVQNNQALKLTFEAIDKLEKTTFNNKKYLIQNERYMVFAYILFLTLVLEIFITNFYLRKKPA